MIEPSRQRAIYTAPLEELELRLGLQARGQSILSLHIDHAAGLAVVVAADPYGEHRVQGATPAPADLPPMAVHRPRPIRDDPQA